MKLYPVLAESGWFGLLIMLMLSLWTGAAHAWCTPHPSSPSYSSAATVTISVPNQIIIAGNVSAGTVLYTSNTASPLLVYQFKCNNNAPNAYGIQNLINSNPIDSSVPTYPTSVSGLGYRLLQPDTSHYLHPYNCGNANCAWSSNAQVSFNLAAAIQFIATGPISNGSTLAGGVIATYSFDAYTQFSGGNLQYALPIEQFVLSNAVTFINHSCTVTTASIAVQLPMVSTSALKAAGATAGTTPFNIQLNCQPGTQISILFDSSTSYTSSKHCSSCVGVIFPASPNNIRGGDDGIGIQIVDSQFSPIAFASDGGSASYVITSASGGTTTLPYYARYYVSGTALPVTPDTFTGTATFTMSYQ